MKKILLTSIGILLCIHLFALANIFTGATSSNWNTSTNWSLAAVPTGVDGNTATLNGSSPACVINATAACNALDCSAYTNTLSGASALTVNGNLTWGTGMTITANGNLSIGANSTITSNGKYWAGSYAAAVAGLTFTLADDFNITGNFAHNTTGTTLTLNGNHFNVKGNWTQSSGRIIAGTTIINFVGTSGTSTLANTASISNPIVFNSTNAISIGSWTQTGGSITYTAASSFTATGTLTVQGAVTLNTSAVNWLNVTFSGTNTFTLSSNLNMTGLLTMGSAVATYTFSGAFNISCATSSWGGTTVLSGNITCTGTATFNSTTTVVNGASFNVNIGGGLTLNTSTVIVTGTANFIMNGTGTLSGAGGTSAFKANLTLNTAGTITIGTTNPFAFNTSTFTITAVGSLVTTSSTLTLGGTLTVNVASLSFATITCNLSTTINGSQGFSMTNFNDVTAGTIMTWKNGNTYTINTAMTTSGTSASHVSFVSASPGTLYTLTLGSAIAEDNSFLDVTDADSSAGETGFSYKGTLSNNLNWQNLPTQIGTISTPFGN